MDKPSPQPDPSPAVLFELHPSSGAPIYRQIVDQVYALVAGGKLRPGDLLPSVRTVAKQADINPMTVSKAYSRLEVEGLVERVRGRGMRLLDVSSTLPLEEREAQVRAMLTSVLQRARQLGLDESQIRQMMNALVKELA